MIRLVLPDDPGLPRTQMAKHNYVMPVPGESLFWTQYQHTYDADIQAGKAPIHIRLKKINKSEK